MKKYVLTSKELYVLCPANVKTGGPELLHQFVYVLNSNGVNAHIVYILSEKDKNITINKEYKKYVTTFYTEKDVLDDKENVIIIPETLFKYISKWKNIQQVMWWLSVDNFERYNGFWPRCKHVGILNAICFFLRGKMQFPLNKIKKVQYHLCQSHYAKDYLLSIGIDVNKIEFLSDYINDEFVTNQVINKERIVMYNPKKGFQYTRKIIRKMPNITWAKIEGMKSDEVHKLMQRSMLYIDFGNHPGKDRMPREAALSMCCVITGMKGSAKYFEDVNIPAKYKIDEKKAAINTVVDLIEDCLNNYETNINDFNQYRELIKNEKKAFYNDVRELFVQSM